MARLAWLLFAIAGLGMMCLGAFIANSQRPQLDAMRARRLDARRRAPLYGCSQRIEPTLN